MRETISVGFICASAKPKGGEPDLWGFPLSSDAPDPASC